MEGSVVVVVLVTEVLHYGWCCVHCGLLSLTPQVGPCPLILCGSVSWSFLATPFVDKPLVNEKEQQREVGG